MMKYALMLVLLVFVLAGMSPAQPNRQVDENTLGQRLVAEFVQETGVRSSPDTDAIQRYIQTIGDRLSVAIPQHPKYTFIYYSNPSFKSAFALPGKQVIVGGVCWQLLKLRTRLRMC